MTIVNEMGRDMVLLSFILWCCGEVEEAFAKFPLGRRITWFYPHQRRSLPSWVKAIRAAVEQFPEELNVQVWGTVA